MYIESSINMSKIEKAKSIIFAHGGIAKTSDFIAEGFFRSDLGWLISKGVIERVRQGYYQIADNYDITDAEYISKLIPEGIVCVESALFYYGYTDFTPREWSIAVPRTVSYAKLKSFIVPHKIYYIQPDNYELGKTQADFDGIILPIYDKERTICDCFKYRNKLDNELFAKAVNAYVVDKEKNLANLSKYAKQLRVHNKMMNMMEVLLNG